MRASETSRLLQIVAIRAGLFFAFWLMIAGWAAKDLPIGLAAAAAATWTSLYLLPAEAGSEGRPQQLRTLHLVPHLAALAWSFVRQSVVSSIDVAWQALQPELQLRPGFIAAPLHVPPGGARCAFCALSSLMPGTLPTGTDENGALVIHCLDVSQPVAVNLTAEENLFLRAFGYD